MVSELKHNLIFISLKLKLLRIARQIHFNSREAGESVRDFINLNEELAKCVRESDDMNVELTHLRNVRDASVVAVNQAETLSNDAFNDLIQLHVVLQQPTPQLPPLSQNYLNHHHSPSQTDPLFPHSPPPHSCTHHNRYNTKPPPLTEDHASPPLIVDGNRPVETPANHTSHTHRDNAGDNRDKESGETH
ncbi:hypothetical protein ACFE04_023679 [Oxalis oulophora]